MAKTSTAGKSSQARRQEPAAHRRSWAWLWVLVSVVVIGGGGVLVAQAAQQSAGIQGVQFFTGLTFNHANGPVKYAQVPPVGGDHSPTVLNCGIYDQPVPSENAVHSLEHGVVWVTYQPTLPQSDVNKLRQAVRGHDFVILSPFTDLPAPVVASGWGVQLQLSGADDARLGQFIRKYEKGPQTREPEATCGGGVGRPIG